MSISTIPPRLSTRASGARYFNVHDRTIRHWLVKGYITGYQDGSDVLIDLDEIERELLTNPHMRDGRRPRYGADAKIITLPRRTRRARAEVYVESDDPGVAAWAPEPEVEQ
jgi:excisionase family DNA binding protein